MSNDIFIVLIASGSALLGSLIPQIFTFFNNRFDKEDNLFKEFFSFRIKANSDILKVFSEFVIELNKTDKYKSFGNILSKGFISISECINRNRIWASESILSRADSLLFRIDKKRSSLPSADLVNNLPNPGGIRIEDEQFVSEYNLEYKVFAELCRKESGVEYSNKKFKKFIDPVKKTKDKTKNPAKNLKDNINNTVKKKDKWFQKCFIYTIIKSLICKSDTNTNSKNTNTKKQEKR